MDKSALGKASRPCSAYAAGNAQFSPGGCIKKDKTIQSTLEKCEHGYIAALYMTDAEIRLGGKVK